MRIFSTVALISASLFAGNAAYAATNFVENFDENVGHFPGNFITLAAGAQIGVFTAGANGIEVQDNYPGLTPANSGTQLIELDTYANSSMFTMIDAGRYTLNFAYSARPGVATASNGIDVFFDDTLLGSFSEDGSGLTSNAFSIKTINFTALNGGSLRFAASGVSDSLGGFVDSVSLSGGAVPEPASWAMMVGGFGMVGGAIRSRRRAALSFA